MKNLFEIKEPRFYKREKVKAKPQHNFKRAPTPLEKHDPYHGICRILPSFVAQNYKYFELLTPPKQKITDWDGYLTRLKKKITCMKAENLL